MQKVIVRLTIEDIENCIASDATHEIACGSADSARLGWCVGYAAMGLLGSVVGAFQPDEFLNAIDDVLRDHLVDSKPSKTRGADK